MTLASMLARFQKMGFEGPFYSGLVGKARFIFESIAWRTEFVFIGTRESFAAARPLPGPDLEIATITAFHDLEPFRTELEAEYYPGYLDTWRRPFTWGEQVMIGVIANRIAGFAWVQRGHAGGSPTYYGCLFENEARVLRVGVVPSFRRQGVNSKMMRGILEQLLQDGFDRVFAESHKYNLPSVRTFLKVGFRTLSAITVVNIPREGEFIRWCDPADTGSHLRTLGLDA
jgi:GNAT superfamily N-acetyltransferase